MPKVNHKARLAELRALRQSGKKAFDNYQVDEVNDVFDEVDEDGYKKLVRERLNQDDFVVDDNGEGYADDGREDWDRLQRYDSDSEADEIALRGRPSKAGTNSFSWPIRLAPSDTLQQRKPARKSKLNVTPTTVTSASSSPKLPARPSPSQRLSRPKTMTTSWLVSSVKSIPISRPLCPESPNTRGPASAARPGPCLLPPNQPRRRGSPLTPGFHPRQPLCIWMMTTKAKCYPRLTTSLP